jgi:hypothetical protein
MGDWVWVRRAYLTASYAIDLHTCLRFEWCNYLSIDEALVHPSDALQRCYLSSDGKWIRECPTSVLEREKSNNLLHVRTSNEYFECHPIHIARDIFAKYRVVSWQEEEQPIPVSSWYLPPELEDYRAIASDEDLYRDWLDKSQWPDPLNSSFPEKLTGN